MSFTLYPKHFPPITLQLKEVDEEDHLILQIQPSVLRQAEVNSWFYIKPELKGPMTGGPFMLSLPLQMELALRPDLIYRFRGLLSEWGDTEDMIRALAWEATQPGAEPDILLQTDSWICLGVQQEQPGGFTSFDTVWRKVLPHLESREISPEDLDFSQVEIYPKQLKGDDGSESPGFEVNLGEGSGEVFAIWPVPDNPRVTPSVPLDIDDPRDKPKLNLMGALTRFLEGKNLRFSMIGNDMLRFSHGGKNGRWSCEAKVWEDAIAFYSLHPFQAGTDRREAIEQWTKEANLRLKVGNFEFDPTNGDMRYRTSAGFTSFSGLENQLQQLWIQNVQTFDDYYSELSGILGG